MHEFWEVTSISSFIVTKPWWLENQDDFLNAVCEFKTDLSPWELLNSLLKVEKNMWRIRDIKWWPRIIDLDIITYNKQTINEENLTIPHKFAKERDFVMMPLKEISKEMYDWLVSL